MYSLDDTIAAIASAPGGAARGIVRISGPGIDACMTALFRPNGEGAIDASPKHPTAIAGSLHLKPFFSPVPCDAYLWKSSRSYTGQPVLELHTIGSPCLLEAVLREVCAAGARLAGPGEFTLRAFLAGRIDLTQAEAVLGVIDADGTEELQTALSQLAGGLAHPLHQLRESLLDLLTHLEAGFDFADEDLSFLSDQELSERLANISEEIASIRRQAELRGDVSHAVRAVLIGKANAGKSSLFNALAGSQAALVSDHPGTTRDYLTADLDLDGVRCRLIDTAGIRGNALGTDNAVEDHAESVSTEQHRMAQVRLLCLDATQPLDENDSLAISQRGPNALIVWTKCDAAPANDGMDDAIRTSSRSGVGLAELRGALRRLVATSGPRGDIVPATAVRCADSLRRAEESIDRARRVAESKQEELVASEIHAALTELGKVTGTIYSEDVLDRIFSRFCVGK